MLPFVEICDILSVKEVVDFYGVEKKQNGRYKCVHHDQQKGSMVVNDKTYFCYSCQSGGNVINLVSAYFGLGLKESLLKLCYDFGQERLLNNSELEMSRKQEMSRKKKEMQKFLSDYGWLKHQMSRHDINVLAWSDCPQDQKLANVLIRAEHVLKWSLVMYRSSKTTISPFPFLEKIDYATVTGVAYKLQAVYDERQTRKHNIL